MHSNETPENPTESLEKSLSPEATLELAESIFLAEEEKLAGKLEYAENTEEAVTLAISVALAILFATSLASERINQEEVTWITTGGAFVVTSLSALIGRFISRFEDRLDAAHERLLAFRETRNY